MIAALGSLATQQASPTKNTMLTLYLQHDELPGNHQHIEGIMSMVINFAPFVEMMLLSRSLTVSMPAVGAPQSPVKIDIVPFQC